MGGEMTDLAAIRARVAAATRGPWETDGVSWGEVRSLPSDCGVAFDVQMPADAELIAHAPTDLLALCAEVERLRGRVEELTTQRADLQQDRTRLRAEVAAAERRGADRALRWAADNRRHLFQNGEQVLRGSKAVESSDQYLHRGLSALYPEAP